MCPTNRIPDTLKRDVPATQARPLAESSKLKAESGLDEPLSFELSASSFDSINAMKDFLVF